MTTSEWMACLAKRIQTDCARTELPNISMPLNHQLVSESQDLDSILTVPRTDSSSEAIDTRKHRGHLEFEIEVFSQRLEVRQQTPVPRALTRSWGRRPRDDRDNPRHGRGQGET